MGAKQSSLRVETLILASCALGASTGLCSDAGIELFEGAMLLFEILSKNR